MTKVELKNVSRVYLGQSGPVYGLSSFDLTIDEGEFVCIVGPSGCGKTTLLNIVAGFEPPDLGEVLINGLQITGPGTNRFVIFQEHAPLAECRSEHHVWTQDGRNPEKRA
jgi:NitT/TauT family transport system ATP-binding protein